MGDFIPTYSTDNIWREENMEQCLSTDLNTIEANIAALQTGKANTNHTHTGYATTDHAHTGYAATNHSHTGYAATNHTHTGYALSAHEHDDYAFETDLTALQALVGDAAVSQQIATAIASKADTNHTHTGYAATSHTHTMENVTGLADELADKYEKPATGIPQTDLAAAVQALLGKADTAIQSLSGYATESYVNTKVADLVDTAPDALNTLNELAAALGDDPNFATTIASQIGGKASQTALDDLAILVGDTAVATQISSAVATKADSNHTHTEYAVATHEHTDYADADHTHTGYAAATHAHDNYAATTHTHTGYAAASDVTALQALVGDTAVSSQINGAIANKADSDHTHSEYAASSHGTHVTFTTTAPKASGTASAGSAATVSRSDHVHPAQTTVSGNAGSATKLATARTIRTNLASTSTASFNGTANVTPGVTGVLPVANGGTGQSKAYTNGTVSSLNSTTITSAQFAVFPYLNKAFIRLNVLLGSALPADSARYIAMPSTVATAHTALSCYNHSGYDIHCGMSSDSGIYVINCGSASMSTSVRLYISGWFSI